MRYILIILCSVSLLIGCQRSMTNDEVISECAKCTKAGLKPVVIQNGFTYEVRKVICVPKWEDRK